MTPEEFESLKSGDRVFANNSLKDNSSGEGEVISKHKSDYDFNDLLILVAVDDDKGQLLCDWPHYEGMFKIPAEYRDKYMWAVNCNNAELLSTSPPQQLKKHAGISCILCGDVNQYAEDNYPEHSPSVFACYSCRDTKMWALQRLKI